MNNPLVQPDPGLFIWTILTFLVLLTLLAKFAWGPLLQALESRQEDDPEGAGRCAAGQGRAGASASGVRADHREGTPGGRRDHHAQPQRRRERCREELRAKARAEADGIVRNAERQIQAETARALQQIRHEAVDLSVAIASKIDPAESVEGRQRAADRRHAEAAHAHALTPAAVKAGRAGENACPFLVSALARRLACPACQPAAPYFDTPSPVTRAPGIRMPTFASPAGASAGTEVVDHHLRWRACRPGGRGRRQRTPPRRSATYWPRV